MLGMLGINPTFRYSENGRSYVESCTHGLEFVHFVRFYAPHSLRYLNIERLNYHQTYQITSKPSEFAGCHENPGSLVVEVEQYFEVSGPFHTTLN